MCRIFFVLVLIFYAESVLCYDDDFKRKAFALWDNYCNVAKHVNESYTLTINKCLARSYQLDEKLITTCMKKIFPTDDFMTSCEQLRDAQCNDDPTKRVELYRGKYMSCMMKGKGTFRHCPDASDDGAFKRCFQKLLLRFTKCAFKMELIS